MWRKHRAKMEVGLRAEETAGLGLGGKKPHGVPMALQSGSSWADPENLHRQGRALE